MQALAISNLSRAKRTARQFVVSGHTVLQAPVQHSAMLRGENVPRDPLGMHCKESPSQPVSGHPEHISNAQPLFQRSILPYQSQ